MRRRCFAIWLCVSFLALAALPVAAQPPETPKAHDPRIVVELVAAAPDIVHPIGVDFDSKGRLLVIESHTHFRPANYKGPEFDRIRMIELGDDNAKGKPRISTFFEGTKATMDIAVHPDGSVYIATRNEILRLRDTKGAGKADVKERIVFLDTKGDYPHNGLSGLCFDSQGNLNFGMGENIGYPYKLIGSDGSTIAGEGDGGHVFWCTADGKKLRRVATGFWNPFGLCRDIYGRMFAVDNDPDAMPPCRLIHVVEGGDYGYQFRYGRQGRHPFQAWNGELPGTLPMICGTGEAPCEVLSYESDGLPEEYLSNLLVTAWADHRVERYRLKPKGASFTSQREPFIQGGKDFRPVGMAVAPDGSIYISDWVRRDYNLHGQGAIWRIRAKDAKASRERKRPEDPVQALDSRHRPWREWGARKLAEEEGGRKFLNRYLELREGFKKAEMKDPRAAAASLIALIDADEKAISTGLLVRIVRFDAEAGMGALAMSSLARRRDGFQAELLGTLLVDQQIDRVDPRLSQIQFASLPSRENDKVLAYLTDSDPFMRHAAILQVARSASLMKQIEQGKELRTLARCGLVLACRASDGPQRTKFIRQFLADPSEDVRFLAAKWIADEKLVEHREAVAAAMKDPKLNARMYLSYATALARIDGQPVNEAKLADYFFDRLADEKSPVSARILSLQLVPAKYPKLSVPLLQKLLKEDDAALRLEAVRTLAEHPDGKRFGPLLDLARNPKLDDALRAQAILGLSDKAQEHVDELLGIALGPSAVLREEALRALIGTKMSDLQVKKLSDAAGSKRETQALVSRVLGKPFFEKRPPAKDIDAWVKHVEGPGDPAAGRRIFAHPKLAGCFRCHRIEGRGNEVGPDLTTIGRTERRAIVESILQPSNNIAPHYQAWQIEMADGKVRFGLLTGTHLDDYTYLDSQGAVFKINTRDVVSMQPAATSIMPDGLVDRLTDQEMRDLLAYLSVRR